MTLFFFIIIYSACCISLSHAMGIKDAMIHQAASIFGYVGKGRTSDARTLYSNNQQISVQKLMSRTSAVQRDEQKGKTIQETLKLPTVNLPPTSKPMKIPSPRRRSYSEEIYIRKQDKEKATNKTKQQKTQSAPLPSNEEEIFIFPYADSDGDAD